MNLFTADEQLAQCRSTGQHYKFHIYDLPRISWEEVFNCLSLNVKYDAPIKTSKNFGLVIHDTSMIVNVSKVLEEFSMLDKTVNSSAHLYISLTDSSETFGWHNDTSDVIFWQVIGKTLFSIKEKYKVLNYTLEVNDLIYIPKGVMHNTKPLTPRVGVSFGLDYS
jgi:ribosomal protein L16 Arg81 hydroxylase